MSALDDIRTRATAATPGPWRWDGYMPPIGSVRLMSDASGRPLVMGFRRLGMQDAQPTFAVGRDMADPGWGGGVMRPAIDLAQTDDRCHRPLLGIDNPDAEFIAHARADVDWLLGEVERLQAALDAAGAVA